MKKVYLKGIVWSTLLLFTFMFAGNLFTACSDVEADYPYKSAKWMIVDKKVVELMSSDKVTINPIFSDSEVEELDFELTSSDPEIAAVTLNYDNSITIEGLKAGKAFVKLECPGETKRLSVTISVTVNQSPTRILAIGNSFSEDAVEQNLYELFKADNIEAIIGNMYIAGCPLETHWNNANTNAAAYEYRKVVNGKKTARTKVSLAEALIDEKWDYISLQQASGRSGQYQTYTAYLPNLISYIKERTTNKYMKLMFHQTWAYAANSNHAEFPNYDKDQMKMYEAIIDAVNKAVSDNNIDILIPSGTAVQNARTSFIGDNFCRDGYHLEYTYGRYVAACTWFEAISGKSAVGNSYAPSGLNELYKDIAQNAAHAAVLKPTVVTTLTEYAEPTKICETLKHPVYVDFGSAGTSYEAGTPWNNFASIALTPKPIWLLDKEGAFSYVSLSVKKAFNTVFGGLGTEPGCTIAGIELPAKVIKDGFVVKNENETGELQLGNLNPNKKYNLMICALRYNDDAGRTTTYTIKGIANQAKDLLTGLASSSTPDLSTKYVKFENVSPASDGTILIEVKPKAGTLKPEVFEAHINAIVLSQAE